MKASAGTLQMPARLECFCLQAAETEGWVVSCRADGMPARKGGNDKSETASDTSWKCRLTLSDVQRVRERKRLWQTGQQSLTLYIRLPVTWTVAEQISSMTGVCLRGMIHCQSLFLIEWSASKVNLCQSLFLTLDSNCGLCQFLRELFPRLLAQGGERHESAESIPHSLKSWRYRFCAVQAKHSPVAQGTCHGTKKP